MLPGADSDPDHLYESLGNNPKEECPDDDYDSFDSDSDSDSSFTKVNSVSCNERSEFKSCFFLSSANLHVRVLE